MSGVDVGQPRPVTEEVGACPPARPPLGRRAGSPDHPDGGRLGRALVVLSMVLVAVVLGLTYAALVATRPVVGALVLSHLACLAVGLWLRDARRSATAAVNEWLDEDLEARKLADAAADRHFVGPISGEVPICGETKGPAPAGVPTLTVVGDDLDPEPWVNRPRRQ